MEHKIINTGDYLLIVDDSEIKKRDYIFEVDTNTVSIADKDYYKNGFDFKIILTTDPKLISDGVQAIDDEFLEWFVKNPSCENVEVEKTFITNSGLGYYGDDYVVLDSNFKVLEVVATISQSFYKIGEITKLDDYEYITEYKIIIPQEEPE